MFETTYFVLETDKDITHYKKKGFQELKKVSLSWPGGKLFEPLLATLLCHLFAIISNHTMVSLDSPDSIVISSTWMLLVFSELYLVIVIFL